MDAKQLYQPVALVVLICGLAGALRLQSAQSGQSAASVKLEASTEAGEVLKNPRASRTRRTSVAPAIHLIPEAGIDTATPVVILSTDSILADSGTNPHVVQPSA
jgi:hypothetical protein